jgi:hypothetical protein
MQRDSTIPRWTAIVAGVGALLLVAGAAIALVRPSALLSPGDPVTGGVRVYADYLVSRDFAVAALLAGALLVRAKPALATLMALTALIQVLDIVLDATTGRWGARPRPDGVHRRVRPRRAPPAPNGSSPR